MADDDLQEGGAIPPKLSPITVKPPVAPAVAQPPAASAEPPSPAAPEAPASAEKAAEPAASATPAEQPAPASPAPAAPAATTPPTVTTTKRPVITRKPVVLRKPGEKPAAPAPAATPAEPPKPAAVAPEGIAISHAEAAKKMTARISLASATGEIPAVSPSEDDIKTIKLRAPSQAAPAAVQAAKSKTSRISLETALNSPETETPSAGGPRTIRLKRPTEMGKGGDAQSDGKIKIKSSPSITAELAPPPADTTAPVQADDEAASQKKTIKVKRPASVGGPKISISKSDVASERPHAASGDGDLQSLSSFDQTSAAPVADKVNPFFIVAAVIAILVTLNLAWIFSAQLFGPNAAVADFAVAQGPDMPDPIGALRVQ